MVASRVRRRYRLLKGGHPFLVLVHYSRGQQIRQSSSLQFLIPISFMPSGSPTFCATFSDSTCFAWTASSTVPAAPAQRAGRVRSWRETRATRATFRSRWGHAAERGCGCRRGRNGRRRWCRWAARRTGDARPAKSRDGSARAA